MKLSQFKYKLPDEDIAHVSVHPDIATTAASMDGLHRQER